MTTVHGSVVIYVADDTCEIFGIIFFTSYKILRIIVLLFIQNISSKLKTSLPLYKTPVVKHLPVFYQFQIMRGYNILADILQMVVFSVFVCYFKVFEGEVQEF